MSTAVRANLICIVSTIGQPILQADANSNPFDSLFGKSIVIDDNRSSTLTAGTKPILFGDLKEGYSLCAAGGFNVRRFDELFGLHNQVVFILYTRVGAQ
jgi:HK97 family phage major capsid protein